jgi:hypothetical protein
MIQSLLGRDISCIDSVLYERASSGVYLICSVYDCGSCLESAFAEVRELEKLLDTLSIKIIGVLADPTPLQVRFEYYDYVAYDVEDLIRRHLKFIPTPVFIVCDENMKVRYVHKPTAGDSIHSVANRLKNQVIRPNL